MRRRGAAWESGERQKEKRQKPFAMVCGLQSISHGGWSWDGCGVGFWLRLDDVRHHFI
jgi:hypothetical protein